MKIVTASQMQRIDRCAIDDQKIPSLELMENAGRGIASTILADLSSTLPEPRFTVVCGKGNNGGDGFVIARYLQEARGNVEVFFLGPIEKLSADARVNHGHALENGVTVNEITSIEDVPKQLDSDYLIDAIFGTGFTGAPRGVSAELIDWINNQDKPIIIAVDIPSGVNADNGRQDGDAVSADQTFSLALPKIGLTVFPGKASCGELQVIPIGIPDDVIEQAEISTNLITGELVSTLLPYRQPDGYKGTFGKVFLLAGSFGMTGAASLSAQSAYRSGSGLVKIGCPKSVLPTISALAPEPTLHGLPELNKKGALALRALGEVRQLSDAHDAIIVGPGLGMYHETQELVRRFLSKLDKPTIIDADAINALAQSTDILQAMTFDKVLTPHVGEFERLTGKKIPDDILDKIDVIQEYANRFNCVLLLKGNPTIIADQSGQSWINPTGNNGMATGGSGDVLSGLIGALLGAGMDAIDATICGAYIHGLAGDIAATELGSRSMIASDIIRYLSDAFQIVEE